VVRALDLRLDLRSSGCAIECNLGQVVCTRVPLSPSSIILYQRKLGSKQAHRATHWPRVHGLAASAGVWLRANESLDQRRPMGHAAQEGLCFFASLHDHKYMCFIKTVSLFTVFVISFFIMRIVCAVHKK